MPCGQDHGPMYIQGKQSLTQLSAATSSLSSPDLCYHTCRTGRPESSPCQQRQRQKSPKCLSLLCVLWREIVLTTSSEPLSSCCPACFSILAYCRVTSKCFVPLRCGSTLFQSAFHLFIFYSKIAFVSKIVLIGMLD